MANEPKQQANTLGNASLALGIASAALVFGIGFCALVGAQQGWVGLAGAPLWICGVSSAFLGLLGVVLGAAGLWSGQSRQTAVAGLVLGLMGICLFFLFMVVLSNG